MFDVIWVDPDRELIGEHRAKKEIKRELKNKEREKEQENSILSRSISVASTRSSTESRFGFLRPRNGKNAKGKEKTPSGLLTPSHHSSRSNSGSYHRSALMANLSNVSLGAERAHRVNTPVFTDASSSHVVKRNQVSQPRPSDLENPDLCSEVYGCSELEGDHPPTPTGSMGDRNFPVPILQPESPNSLVPSLNLPKEPKAPVVINFRPNDPDSWRPPEEWEYIDRQAEEARMLENQEDVEMTVDVEETIRVNPSTDFESVKDQVKVMAASSPSMILARIKEIWTVTDERLHGELNIELKRWMLSVLHYLDIEARDSAGVACVATNTSDNLGVLALYESEITATYIAALHSTREVYTLTTASFQNKELPNIHPVLVPSMTSSTLPFDQHSFTIVYSLSLPAVCSSPEIPEVLKNISTSLRVGGSLQLTLIDPLPCASTLGHRMRAWLQENLLINLERHFKCTNPSRLFPEWMGDAGLRGQGSTLTTSKFYAVSASIRSQADHSDPFIDRIPSEREVKAEVRSIIGRLLWMEVWGSFVTGDKWWWEDEGCVNECLQLGTVWEYHMIDGVKQGQEDIPEEVEDLENLEH
ncbi:hypothetical protein FPCIR_9625 [Fusarium pseudocircinatum]|uniref:Uncharacterized protein n=1 Tax=Fusarium pseudocircinatum TaxID=56676 RepID=A0A8H5NXS8_9HYPO|nr:hypothetical protein FPCIR_9625 [Fusarium pseudocircinatum]